MWYHKKTERSLPVYKVVVIGINCSACEREVDNVDVVSINLCDCCGVRFCAVTDEGNVQDLYVVADDKKGGKV